MTTAYFLKLRTTKKTCHRSSFQTARGRRMVRRKHRGKLTPHTRNAYLPRSSPYFKEILSCHFCGMTKEYRQLSAYILALYHIDAVLSIKYERMFAIYCYVKIDVFEASSFWHVLLYSVSCCTLCRGWWRGNHLPLWYKAVRHCKYILWR